MSPLLVFGLALSSSAFAQSPTSRDLGAPIQGTSDLLRQNLNRNRQLIDEALAEEAELDSAAKGGVVVTVNRPSGALRGNAEAKVEVEQEFFDANQILQLGRIKTVFYQGHNNLGIAPNLWVYLHVAREWLISGGLSGQVPDGFTVGGGPSPQVQQGRSNNIIEFNPRLQRTNGRGISGLELGVTNEGRFELTRVRLRPFIDWRIGKKAFVFGSVNVGYTFLELDAGEPDFAFATFEPGFRGFVSRMSIMGVNGKIQIGSNVNDDGTARFLDQSEVPRFGLTKWMYEWRASGFYHHRFRNNLGMTVWVEVGQLQDTSTIDNFAYRDQWLRPVVFLEYPFKPGLVGYLEINGRLGQRRLAHPQFEPVVFGFADDFDYQSLGSMAGFNYFF